jgi:hypothetical protein
MYSIPNGYLDTAIPLYSVLDMAPKTVLPSNMWISVKRQLAVVTADSDILEVL